jgi:predicted nucleic-acid-binding protein
VTIAVDTNVLVRYLTWDDVAQARAAARVIEGGESIAISTTVLCELVWVLRRAYRLSVTEVADSVQEIIESRNVITDRPAAEVGLELLRRGGDFADGIVLHDAEAKRCRHVATFDQAFADLLGDRALLLG